MPLGQIPLCPDVVAAASLTGLRHWAIGKETLPQHMDSPRLTRAAHVWEAFDDDPKDPLRHLWMMLVLVKDESGHVIRLGYREGPGCDTIHRI